MALFNVNEPVSAGGGPQLPLIWHLFSEDAVLPRLLLLAKMIDRVTARQLQTEFGLSLAQWRVLAFVCLSGPATAAFIGDAAEVDQAEISRAVRALEGRGLVTRTFEPGNRKNLIITPTADGAKAFKRIRRMRQAYFARMTRKLSREQMTQLNRSLAAVGQEVVVERGADD